MLDKVLNRNNFHKLQAFMERVVSKATVEGFDRNSAKISPNSWIIFVDITSVFETFLTIEETLSVLTFWKVKARLDSLTCSLKTVMLGCP